MPKLKEELQFAPLTDVIKPKEGVSIYYNPNDRALKLLHSNGVLETISTGSTGTGGDVDLSNYYTISEVDAKFNNLKTINGTSLIGPGDIVISGGSGSGNANIDDTSISTATTYSSSKIDSVYAKKVSIPTKVSDLENDSNYIKADYVDTKVAELVNSAPSTLDTLKELSDALGGDPNFATTVATQIGGKQDKLTAGTGITITNNVISATGGTGTANIKFRIWG